MRQKILYGLLALVVSFGLWLYVITVENPNSETTFYNIPVVLDNESVLTDRGLMVLNSKNPTVTLKLSGNRSHLNKLNSGEYHRGRKWYKTMSAHRNHRSGTSLPPT